MSKKPPRSSTMGESATGGRGQGSGAAPRMSARGGAPRTSNSGGVRGMRASHRQSSVGRGGTQLTEEATGLQVLDEQGVDRTPKPLMSTGGGTKAAINDSNSMPSETSEFFLDRMSSARGGWSETGSGIMTPKSTAGSDDGYDMGAKHGSKAYDEDDLGSMSDQPEEVIPVYLTERELDRQVYLTLEETETFFMWSMPGITVPMDSEDAKTVEAANKKYADLLILKQSADKFSNVETQTLDLLTKNREVQSAVVQTASVPCQAAAWDIEDTYREVDDALADAEEAGVAGNVPSIGQLAGSVAKGNKYGGKSNSGGGNSRSTALGSNVFGDSMAMSGFGNRDTIPSAQSGVFGQATGPGVRMEGEAPAEEEAPADLVDPLHGLPGLLDTLQLMDSAITQNLYFPKLLLYRDIRNLATERMPSPVVDPVRALENPSGLRSNAPSRPLSRNVSRAPSRAASEMSMGGNENMMAKLQSLTIGGGSEASRGGPASVAESAWPEDLLQDLADLGPDGAPRIELLWEWKLPGEQKVACMAWNKARPDLLAVGYGDCEFAKDQDEASPGHVAFWSLKNPQSPLWVFETRAGVTALDFAAHTPNILAVGLYDGAVCIYDVKSKTGSPTMESDASTGRHSDPVWKVKWIDRGAEHDEPLVSISTDGRVTQWSIAKGLEFADLMKLKRVPRKPTVIQTMSKPNATQDGTGKKTDKKATGTHGEKGVAGAAPGGNDHDAFISRLTSGMSFDFSARDERIYIAGTEDGWIHRCSTSYSEQYLESYEGHMGPVYNVQWSPFKKDMFISASGDWTMRLWQEGRETALLTFTSGNHEVNDAQWCPANSTVFGSVTSGGRLEIWDFDLSTVKPVVTHKAGQKLSCMLFSERSPIVACGGESGAVSVFRLYNIDREYESVEEQVSRLDDTIRANVMKQQAGKMNV